MKLIAAVTEDYGVGLKNDLLFKFKKDLTWFKEVTMGQTCIMGYNTFMSLPIPKGYEAPLPGRKLVVLCHATQIPDCLAHGATMLYTKVTPHFIEKYEDAFVIGGPYCWESLAPYIDTLYLTHIKATVPADAFFPKDAFLLHEPLVWRHTIVKQEIEEGISLSFVKYIRS